MSDEYVFLIEKEEMWARMLLEVLEDNHVPCVSLPVYGVAVALKTGKQERLKVYVPASYVQQATELVEALFSEESILEEE